MPSACEQCPADDARLPVRPEAVARTRAATRERKAPWTDAELDQLAAPAAPAARGSD